MLINNIYLPKSLFKAFNNKDVTLQRPNDSIDLAAWVKTLVSGQGVFSNVSTSGTDLILTRLDGSSVTVPMNPLYSTVQATKSIEGDGSTTPLQLVGDLAGVATHHYYGTSANSNKTFHNLAVTFTQLSPSTTWTIQHDLGLYPQITLVDNTGDELFGDVTFVDYNIVEITFSAPVSGKAYISK